MNVSECNECKIFINNKVMAHRKKKKIKKKNKKIKKTKGKPTHN